MLGNIFALILDVLVVLGIVVQHFGDDTLLGRCQAEFALEPGQADVLRGIQSLVGRMGKQPVMQVAARHRCAERRAADKDDRQNGQNSWIGPCSVLLPSSCARP